MKNLIPAKLTVAILSAVAASWVHAEEVGTVAQDETIQETSLEGDEITVQSTREAQLTSATTLSREEINNRPKLNGNITDLLRSNPVVQFSSSGNSSLQQGEIKPADISIHGSMNYQNSFLIDGMSANSDLDPANSDTVTITRLSSSDEQGVYIDTSLLDSITVYDSNIPVEFGGFTGGVIDAKTRSWQGETKIKAFVRGTDSSWNKFIIDPNLSTESSDADFSKPAQFQDEYRKIAMGFNAEFGIGQDTGVVLGYTRRHSRVPTGYVPTEEVVDVKIKGDWPSQTVRPVLEKRPGGVKTLKRTSDNFFGKLTHYFSPDTQANLSVLYSKYDANNMLNTAHDSDYTDKHDSLGFLFDLTHKFEKVLLTSSVGYTHMTDERDSLEDNQYQVDRFDEFKKIQSSVDGGLGDLKAQQDTVSLKTKLEFDPIEYLGVSHNYTVGVDLSYVYGLYSRNKDYYRWNLSEREKDVWSEGYTVLWKSGEWSDNFFNMAFYLQDEMKWKNLTVRPGARIEYDSFTEQVNLAPRLALNYDVLGNKKFNIYGGVNRYYGRNLLAYALYKAQNGGMYTSYGYETDSNDLENWGSSADAIDVDGLKSPVDDEFTVGANYDFGVMFSNLTYVHREGKNGIRSTTIREYGDPTTYWKFNNSGFSKHDSVAFTLVQKTPWNFVGGNHTLGFSIAWQDTKTNNDAKAGYYDNTYFNYDANRVVVDGKLISADDLEGTDFNIPVKANLMLTSKWNNLGITWFNTINFESNRDQVLRDGERTFPDPESRENITVRNYKTVHFDSIWSYDTKVQYKPNWAYGLGMSVEVTNVFNNKNAVDKLVYKGDEYNLYNPGRTFWLELNYEY